MRAMAEDAGDPKNKTVLIVDDDESILNLLEILVKRDGFKVDTAATGERALSRLERNPHALLLDLMLPGGTTGFEVLRRIRESKRPAIPIIIVTAYASDPAIKQVEQDPNVVEILSKPINQEKLLAALHKALKTRAPLREPKPQKPV